MSVNGAIMLSARYRAAVQAGAPLAGVSWTVTAERPAVSAAGSTNSSASQRCLSLPSGWSHTPAGVPSTDTAACW